MWQHSMPSNLITQTHQRDLFKGQDSPPERPELQEEETLDFQEEYPQEVAVEAEEEEAAEVAERPNLHNKQTPMTNSLATHHLRLQGIE